MSAHGTWQQTGGSGGGDFALVLAVIAGLAFLIGPAGAAVGALVHVVFIAVGVTAATAAAALTTYAVWRWRHPRQLPITRPELPPQPARAIPATADTPPAIEYHNHYHGISPDELAAAIIRQQQHQP